MSRTRIVKGNITKVTGGNYKMFSKENIEFHSNKEVIFNAKEGITYGEPESPPKTENEIVFVNGHFYNEDGTFEGKVDKKENTGSVNDVYTCTGKSKKKDKDGIEIEVYDGITQLKENSKNITYEKFIKKSATVYGESSHDYGIDNKEEIFAIASVHERNKIAFGATSAAAKSFINTADFKRNGTFKQTAIAAVINALIGGIDYSFGATMWDGQEQSQIGEDDDTFSNGRFEYHVNTMGWTISDEHFKSWKSSVGSTFKAPQMKYTPGKNPKNKYATSNTIALKSTAQYAKTIFWKELKKRLVKPEEKKHEKTKG